MHALGQPLWQQARPASGALDHPSHEDSLDGRGDRVGSSGSWESEPLETDPLEHDPHEHESSDHVDTLENESLGNHAENDSSLDGDLSPGNDRLLPPGKDPSMLGMDAGAGSATLSGAEQMNLGSDSRAAASWGGSSGGGPGCLLPDTCIRTMGGALRFADDLGRVCALADEDLLRPGCCDATKHEIVTIDNDDRAAEGGRGTQGTAVNDQGNSNKSTNPGVGPGGPGKDASADQGHEPSRMLGDARFGSDGSSPSRGGPPSRPTGPPRRCAGECCATYEYCVAACLGSGPTVLLGLEGRAPSLPKALSRLVRGAIDASAKVGDKGRRKDKGCPRQSSPQMFGLCAELCRTNSRSLRNQNTYKNKDAPFCFKVEDAL